jgi:ubiquinone/menaquinone biosynthesis C-methylase UbiE
MNYQKQVDRSIYQFSSYMTKQRWCSVWHQLDEVQKLKPQRVLEIGVGPGLFKAVAATFGIAVETMDIDPDLKPDHVGSATAMPFDDSSYDVVCAFQMLEHVPYEAALQAFDEMVRVSRRYVVISLPDARSVWCYKIHLPKFGTHDFLVPRPQIKAPVHEFDGEHYWEINKADYPLSRVTTDFSKQAHLIKTYRVFENPYHRFLIFEH